MSTDRQFACSFCGKRQSEVAKLIAGPQAFICNECVELCRTLYSPAPNSHPSPLDFVKLCMDCKWAQHHLVGVGHDVTGTWYCAHPSVVKRYKPDLVTGQARRSRGVRCAKVRKRDYDPTGSVEWCGPEGSFWQPRDEGHELLEFGFGDPPQSE